MADFDLVIRNARIVDGTGTPWYRGDAGVRDGVIAAVGTLPPGVPCAEEIDAGGEVLAPGFIDMHTHNDFLLLGDGAGVSKLRQGVTTILVGQCGISAAPIRDERVPLLDAYTGFIRAGVTPEWNWRSFAEYLDVLDGLDLGLNVGSFVGHGTIRLNVLGFENRLPSPDELREMREMARAALEEGAFGMTSGLIYPPGVYSTSGEVEEIARGLTERRGLYLSHMRNESSGVVESVRETIAVAERAGIPAQVLHHKATGRANHGKVRETLALLEEARERGVDMTVDQYPYTAGSTTLRSILPPWVNEGGLEKLMERLRDPVLRERIRQGDPDDGQLGEHADELRRPGGCPGGLYPGDAGIQGKRLPEIGEMTGRDP